VKNSAYPLLSLETAGGRRGVARGINLDSITIDLEGNIDLRGFTGISSDVMPGAQGFKVNVNIKSSSASREQIVIYTKSERSCLPHLIP
jgi:hypothetical protein